MPYEFLYYSTPIWNRVDYPHVTSSSIVETSMSLDAETKVIGAAAAAVFSSIHHLPWRG
jgi:hypothetical protein